MPVIGLISKDFMGRVLIHSVTCVTHKINTMKDAKKPARRDYGLALNIRNFPEDLRWLCRERANRDRVSLRNFVIAALRDAATPGRRSGNA